MIPPLLKDKNFSLEKSNFFAAYPDVLTPDDLAEILRITRRRVYSLLSRGSIRSVIVGGKHRIPKMNVIEFITKYKECERRKK